MKVIARSFFARDSREAAPELIGKRLHLPEDGIVVRIVEVEAYAGREDPAAHSFRGETPRTRVMFGSPGHAYVYFNYGMHWALNAVAGSRNGHGILIRAAEPLDGLDVIRSRRHTGQKRLPTDTELLRGPGNLTKGLGITGEDGGIDLCSRSSRFFIEDAREDHHVVIASPRVGIREAVDEPWRFSLKGSRYVSRPLPRERD